MKLNVLYQIQNTLKALNGFENPHGLEDYIQWAETNSFVVKVEQGVAEIAIYLKKNLLESFKDKRFLCDIEFKDFSDLSIIVEELSHFNMYCLRAMRDENVSSLELEVQAEVDKFGMALEWLQSKNEEHLREKVFSMHFDKCHLGDWVQPDEKIRYQEAHDIARRFCRKIMANYSGEESARKRFQLFFGASREEKLSPRY